MTIPVVQAVPLTATEGSLPLLVVGPSLGTSVEALWSACAAELAGEYDVVGWDLPGHGRSRPVTEAFSVAELAAGVLALADETLRARGTAAGSFAYAGDSLGGAVGLQLLLDAPRRVAEATLIATGGRIATPESWRERASLVRSSGTRALVDSTPARWFAPGFAEPVAGELLAALEAADDESYALACDALADFDVRLRLGDISAPVLAVAGRHDHVTPTTDLAGIAGAVRHGRLVVLEGCGHLPPAEAPLAVAGLVRGAAADGVRGAGTQVRRAVLGNAHVDRATAGTTPFTSDFQDLITRYAWGEIWARPGLDRRSRSIVTLTALVALGHDEELAMHVRGALRNGLSEEEIKEVLLQTAVYCGVPAANSAFRIAQRVMAEPDQEDQR